MSEVTLSDRVGDLFGGLLGGLAANPLIQLMATGIGAYIVVLWLATAWWAMQDMRRRHQDPAMPYLAGGMLILASPVVFPLAFVVYWLLRPAETLSEVRERELEDLLEELDPLEPGCPGCRRPVDSSWLTCPACRTRLAYKCTACERSMELDWSLCAWCGEEFGVRRDRKDRVAALAPAAPAAAVAATAVSTAAAAAVAATDVPVEPMEPAASGGRATASRNGASRRRGRGREQGSERIRT
jgi:hypothetical protein